MITYIKKVEVTGLWDRFDVTWELDPKVNVLVGINGSGKTTILELIKYALENKYGKAPHPQFKITFDTGESLCSEKEQPINEFSPRLHSEFISTFDIPVGERDEKFLDAQKRELTAVLEQKIERLNTEVPPERINPMPNTNEFVKIVNEVFKGTGKTTEVQFNSDNRQFHVEFRLADGRKLTPNQLSAGEKQILIILLTALISKFISLKNKEAPCVFIMDEPEISLHLGWQKNLIDYILRLNEDTQIIIATHSPGIVVKGWLGKVVDIHRIKRNV